MGPGYRGGGVKECEEGVRVGSQVVGCRWHSLTGLRPQRLAMPLCSVLLLQRGDIKKKNQHHCTR